MRNWASPEAKLRFTEDFFRVRVLGERELGKGYVRSRVSGFERGDFWSWDGFRREGINIQSFWKK